MAAQKSQFIKIKLDFLDQQKEALADAMKQFQSEHIDKVVQEGRAWLDNPHQNFHKMTLMIENSCLLVTQACEELLGEVKMDAVKETSFSPSQVQASSLSTVPTTQMSPVSEKTIDQGKELSARMRVVEEAMESLCTKKKEAEQKQADMEKKITELSKKQTTAKKKVEKLENTISTLEQEHTDKLEKLDQELLQVKTEGKSNTGRLVEWKGELDKLAAQQAQMKKEKTELQENLQTLCDDVIKKKDQTRTDIQTLKTELNKTSSALDSVLNSRELGETKLQGIEDRLKTVEDSHQSDREKTEAQLDNVELKYKAACKIMASRVAPLEKLREILNKKIANRVRRRDRNVRKLHEVIGEVSTLKDRVSHLESNKPKKAVGFSAVSTHNPSTRDTTISSYSTPSYNVGNRFDPSSGEFTVPADGLCVVGLRVWQSGSGWMDVRVSRKSADGKVKESVCRTSTSLTTEDYEVRSDTQVWQVKASDKLFVVLGYKSQSSQIPYVRFSCCMLE